ncbi:hypothetical protein EN866_19545 [Mesorhizobium sp. M2D.F.Ca.ET.223.01.1.1]|uniref:hypothetical protein n=1 Tax=unclassified Mesorhizobium TaxID=325217 RepID=UPI000FCB010F|nr:MULTISPECIES: hypothetical protein [unclassified Mesorhizobium]TGP89356.1 hypothetical protein EN864_19555 [bacterium M00.F.Ca.ET.221.01.1.1]TGP94729.1 hypothetical protein EN865_15425 [bacterium M00.F.Ca.ET.222.01.1.1]RVD58857.1 hypothetical protein EN783_14570 [Mesorhizobium sp. M2D.F.Ca.ET.140.01.1.1]TGP27886.1 hypothetical protein EN875_033055 [Mesorhizobium sp. M2D.F.Ca.ET.232.01.1.1]TGP75897.1 hypothetical protein EN867_15425 [Mesorhizobium sp. M2D.F.Ca.ET.224.01.1.1]
MATSNARLCFENLLENGTVVASSEDAANPVANAYDWLTSDFFKPAASGTINIDLTLSGADSADYFAFYGHDLYAHGGTIKLQWWDGASWVDCFTAVTPTDGTPQVVTFASQTSTKWRVVITCTSVFSIAVISFGAQLPLEYGMYLGWTPPKFGRNTQLTNSQSDGGAFLGRSIIAKGVKSSLDVQYASDAWMRANWLTFVEHAEQKPFFFVPNIGTYPGDSVFAFTDADIPAPTQTHFGRMGTSIPILGMVE